jgi:hypothetical protein
VELEDGEKGNICIIRDIICGLAELRLSDEGAHTTEGITESERLLIIGRSYGERLHRSRKRNLREARIISVQEALLAAYFYYLKVGENLGWKEVDKAMNPAFPSIGSKSLHHKRYGGYWIVNFIRGLEEDGFGSYAGHIPLFSRLNLNLEVFVYNSPGGLLSHYSEFARAKDSAASIQTEVMKRKPTSDSGCLSILFFPAFIKAMARTR